MKKIILIYIVFLTNTTYGQTKVFPDNLISADIDKETSLILDRPITNREYLTYLMWTATVYADYPQNLINAFPLRKVDNLNLIIDKYNNSKAPFQELFKYCPEFVANYMFNPLYIDYPVIGISWYQANKFNKWLTDRWNEYRLIQLGHFTFNKNQLGDDCFTTESFLADQYYGTWNGIEQVTWSDNIFLPTFTLPTSYEIEKVKKPDIRKYPYNSESFLSKWCEWLVSVNDSTIKLNHSIHQPEIIKVKSSDIDIKQFEVSELILDRKNKESDKKKILLQSNQNELNYSVYSTLEKDSTGGMRYFILGSSSDKTPLIIENYHIEFPKLTDTLKINIFRYSVNKN